MSYGGASLPSLEALAGWMPRQRWFAAKTRRISRAVVGEAVRLGPGVVLLVEVELDGGRRERYAIPLLAGDEIHDALGDAEFCRVLLGLLAERAPAGRRAEQLLGRPR